MSLIEFVNLFAEFRASSWDAWRSILQRITPEVRELYAIVGRGAGKSRIVALLACYFASREYPHAPGEYVFIGVFAPDRKQSTITFRYVLGLLKSVPALSALIVRETRESVELHNGIVLEVLTASVAAPRGRSYTLAIIEEAAFLPTDTSVNPDVELLRAVRPALARVPGSLLAVVSSPYARRGVLFDAWKRYHNAPDSHVVLVQSDTLSLNPIFDQRAIAQAYVDDAASASAEYGGLFRGDIETFVSAEAVAACVIPGRYELPPLSTQSYVAFVDPSGGSVDSFTLCIGHREADTPVIDVLRETVPPFSPEAIVQTYAALLTTYRIRTVTGDRYAGEWPREQFAKHGITYEPADRPKSDLYRDALPLLNSGRLALLDHPKTIAQLTALERKTARGGRDSIDHPPGGRDDLANVLAGCAVALAAPSAGFDWRAAGMTSPVTWDDEEYGVRKA